MKIKCPYCLRDVSGNSNRYTNHWLSDREQYCPLSSQPIPPVGMGESEHRRRASIACQLAAQLRDQDPAITHAYLAVQERTELERLTVAALAAIPIDRPMSDIYEWVIGLPVAVES